jgi:hypothetical protein
MNSSATSQLVMVSSQSGSSVTEEASFWSRAVVQDMAAGRTLFGAEIIQKERVLQAGLSKDVAALAWHCDTDRKVLGVDLFKADGASVRLDAFGHKLLARRKVGRGHGTCVRKWR